MDFKDEIHRLGERVVQLRAQLQTEEATKQSLVLPFIQCLGYDIFNPTEVIAEFTADFGTKKGEKVDYAIMRDGVPVLLVECKCCGEHLDTHGSQLFRYFTAQGAKFGLLTNGLDYWFFTDFERQNIMDTKPFMAFDITQIKDATIEDVKKFHKSYFDSGTASEAANELWYVNAVKTVMQQEFKTPSEDFVRFLLSKGVYEGIRTKGVLARFTATVQRSLSQLLLDMVGERLQSALTAQAEAEAEALPSEGVADAQQADERKVETTATELEAFFIVKSILRRTVAPERIGYKDRLTYFAIQLDGNSHKTVCRLYFDGHTSYLGLFDADKHETRQKLKSLDELFEYAGQLETAVKTYEAKPVQQ